MNTLSLFSQISAITIAVTIGYFYVQPTIEEIGVIQTDTATYQTERVKIEAINSQLAANVSAFQSISRIDKERLAAYMPKTLDDISIMRDISFIAQEALVNKTSLEYEGVPAEGRQVFSQNEDSQLSERNKPATPHAFDVTIEGSYSNIKAFLRLLEQTEYPLEVHELEISTNEAASLSARMQLVTYVDHLVLVNDN